MFSVFKGYKTPSDEKLFQNITKDRIILKPNIVKFAKENNKTALYQIGEAYYNLRTKLGYLKAFDWYQKSAASGSAIAQNRIGEMYHHGLGVNKDYHQAIEWYFLATETGGSSAAHNNLGTMYYDGKGVSVDHVKALTCFSVAANQGFREAQYNLGWMYDSEYSPVHDKLEAIKWYTKAAEQGHEEARKRIVQLNRIGIRYHPELGASQRQKAAPSASKSTSGARMNPVNGTKGAGRVINIQQNTITTTIKNDVTLSSEQVNNIININQKHADMVTSKREERSKKALERSEEEKEIQSQITSLKKEQELLQEKMKIEKELRLQKEKETELEYKNKEQEKIMQELREKMEKERIDREEEKKREQQQVEDKLKMLENMIAEMKTQSSLELPQLLTENITLNKPDDKTGGDTKIQEADTLLQNTQNRNIYPLRRTLKRQSKQLAEGTDKMALEHCEKEELVSDGKEAVESEEDNDDYGNDFYLDDFSEEEEIDHINDLYYDSSEE